MHLSRTKSTSATIQQALGPVKGADLRLDEKPPISITQPLAFDDNSMSVHMDESQRRRLQQRVSRSQSARNLRKSMARSQSMGCLVVTTRGNGSVNTPRLLKRRTSQRSLQCDRAKHTPTKSRESTEKKRSSLNDETDHANTERNDRKLSSPSWGEKGKPPISSNPVSCTAFDLTMATSSIENQKGNTEILPRVTLERNSTTGSRKRSDRRLSKDTVTELEETNLCETTRSNSKTDQDLSKSTQSLSLEAIIPKQPNRTALRRSRSERRLSGSEGRRPRSKSRSKRAKGALPDGSCPDRDGPGRSLSDLAKPNRSSLNRKSRSEKNLNTSKRSLLRRQNSSRRQLDAPKNDHSPEPHQKPTGTIPVLKLRRPSILGGFESSEPPPLRRPSIIMGGRDMFTSHSPFQLPSDLCGSNDHRTVVSQDEDQSTTHRSYASKAEYMQFDVESGKSSEHRTSFD